ncbi:MAG: hypothetical protein WCM76_14910 [Bacteroidota bacterium]
MYQTTSIELFRQVITSPLMCKRIIENLHKDGTRKSKAIELIFELRKRIAEGQVVEESTVESILILSGINSQSSLLGEHPGRIDHLLPK